MSICIMCHKLFFPYPWEDKKVCHKCKKILKEMEDFNKGGKITHIE